MVTIAIRTEREREREKERERERGVWKKYTIHLPGSLLYFPIKLTVIRACELLILVLVELKKRSIRAQ